MTPYPASAKVWMVQAVGQNGGDKHWINVGVAKSDYNADAQVMGDFAGDCSASSGKSGWPMTG